MSEWHSCVAIGCRRIISQRYVFCKYHWRKLSPAIRDRIEWAYCRADRLGRPKPTEDYKAAVQEGIAALRPRRVRVSEEVLQRLALGLDEDRETILAMPMEEVRARLRAEGIDMTDAFDRLHAILDEARANHATPAPPVPSSPSFVFRRYEQQEITCEGCGCRTTQYDAVPGGMEGELILLLCRRRCQGE